MDLHDSDIFSNGSSSNKFWNMWSSNVSSTALGRGLTFREEVPSPGETDLFLLIAFWRERKEKNQQFQLPPVCPDKYFTSPRLSIFDDTLS
jgi:hypothetical protein